MLKPGAEAPLPAGITRAVPGQGSVKGSIGPEVLAAITAILNHSEPAEATVKRRRKIRQSIAERTRGGSSPLAHCEQTGW